MHTFPRVALFTLLVAGAAASCDLFSHNNVPPNDTSIGAGCPDCCNGCDVVSAVSAVGTGISSPECSPATASVNCDDSDPCTKDLCALGGVCAHAQSTACMGPGAYVFAHAYSATTPQNDLSVATDAQGNTLFAGAFLGAIDLGDQGLVSPPSGSTVFLAALDPAGHLLWSRALGTGANAAPIAIAANANGEFAITGGFVGLIDLGGGVMSTSAGTQSGFVARYDAGGNLLWGQVFTGTGKAVGLGVAVDVKGDVAITGNFLGDLSLAGATLMSASKSPTFVAMFDSTGALVWGNAIRDDGDLTSYPGHRVAFDGQGDVVLAGSFDGVFDLGDGPTGIAGVLGAFVAKLDPKGKVAWKQASPQPESMTAVQGLAVTNAGDILVSGSYTGEFAFAPGKLVTALGDNDLFLARFGADGAPLSASAFGDQSNQLFCTVAAAADGGAILAGSFTGTLTFGATALSTTGPADTDVFVAKLDGNNTAVWGKRFGDSKIQAAEAIAADPKGGATIVGSMSGIIDLGGGPLAADDSLTSGIFVAKFGP